MSDNHKHTNRLINETSPYLLQHAHNPVDWFPWNEEALQKAREEDKPIFLSIGYSACHWCHVMEHESFESEEIAKLMNENFVNIKVDREERPDLDEIYMSSVQAMTGAGGWPMSVFLTPDLKPFYGGTYFPPRDMYGRPGFPTLLQSLAETWKNRRDEVNQAAEKMTEHIQNLVTVPPGQGELNYDLITNAFHELSRRFEPRHGGFGTEPKFPHSMDLSLLLRYHYQHPDENEAMHMVDFTLKKMARGGMYDQIGGGFHRYSVDSRWLIPHFEKMLYDNALLVKTYTEAWQQTKDPFYKRIVKETLEYIKREMTSPEGFFYSTQDADTEGEEGKFFVWTKDEIKEVLADEKMANVAIRYFGVEDHGNFEHGKNVLHVAAAEEDVAKLEDMTVDELQEMLGVIKCKLFGVRDQRVKPGRDEKILTDWNGLMISAMAFAGNVFQESEYVDRAETACKALLDLMEQEGRLKHTAKEGRVHTDGFLSDYAFLIHGLIDTYEATHNPDWLEQAVRWNHKMNELFWDDDQGAFFYTSKDQKNLIARSKNPMDNAIPSGNSIAFLNLLRLSEILGDPNLRGQAEQSLLSFKRALEEIPMGYPQMLVALDFLLSKPKEIVLSGDSAEKIKDMKTALFNRFRPHKVVLYADGENARKLAALTSVVEGKSPVDSQATAYVCENFSCQQPVTDVESMLQQVT